MTRNSKSRFYTILLMPGRTCFLLGVVLYLSALLFLSLPLLVSALLLWVTVLRWQRGMSQKLGHNFLLIPSMPLLDGTFYYFLCQRPQRNRTRQSCRELRHSLIEDRKQLPAQLPAGRYCTITHGNVLHVLQRCSNVVWEGEPRFLYRSTLRPILNQQSGGRCRHCKSRCCAWNAPERDFFLVHFRVLYGDADNHPPKCSADGAEV